MTAGKTAGRFAKKALGNKKLRYFEVPAARALWVATPPESWGRIKPSGSIRLPKGEPRPPKTLYKIGEALGVDAGELFDLMEASAEPEEPADETRSHEH